METRPLGTDSRHVGQGKFPSIGFKHESMNTVLCGEGLASPVALAENKASLLPHCNSDSPLPPEHERIILSHTVLLRCPRTSQPLDHFFACGMRVSHCNTSH